VEDRVRDRGCRAHDSDLAEPLHPERADLVVMLVDEDDFDVFVQCRAGSNYLRGVVFRSAFPAGAVDPVFAPELLTDVSPQALGHGSLDAPSCNLRMQVRGGYSCTVRSWLAFGRIRIRQSASRAGEEPLQAPGF
jgi:hypothetical protein